MNQATLLHKYLNGTITEGEVDCLFAYLKENVGADAGWEEVLESTYLQSLSEEPALSRKEHREMIDRLMERIQKEDPVMPVHRIHFIRRWGWAAAAMLLGLTTGIYFLLSKPLKSGQEPHREDLALNRTPGKKGAVLTLADGTEVVLDSVGNGVIAKQQGAQVMLKNNQLVYLNETLRDMSSENRNVFNTVTTPRSRQYMVALPDGTKVWLNAASSLRFPVRFAQTERTVILNGEAYFEVASNAAAPFKVVSGQQEILVLGTNFNVSAYDDEPSVKTTLLEGSIKVSPVLKSSISQILQPGQQSILESSRVNVSANVDVQDAIAWKNGQLSMKNLDVKALMRQISRWYDVDVVYEGALPEGHFGGIINANVHLFNIIEVLEAGGIRCRVEGKKLYVSAK